jgi:hypothetical protein
VRTDTIIITTTTTTTTTIPIEIMVGMTGMEAVVAVDQVEEAGILLIRICLVVEVDGEAAVVEIAPTFMNVVLMVATATTIAKIPVTSVEMKPKVIGRKECITLAIAILALRRSSLVLWMTLIASKQA